MNCNRLNIAFAGTPEFAAVALDALLASSHTVVGVLTQPDRPAGRGRKLTQSAVKLRAMAANVPVQQPLSLKEPKAVDAFQSLNADVLVVAAYGLILPQAVLDTPAMGCLNIHGSLLPRWRGAAPIHRAILAGDHHTGVCIMQMDAGLDTGGVLLSHQLAIGADETSAQLHDRLAAAGADALIEALPRVCSGVLQPVAQPAQGVTYAEKLSKSEAKLDFSNGAEQLHRRIRAFNPWPVAEAQLCGERVRLWRSQRVERAVDEHSPGTIIEQTGSYLRVSTGVAHEAIDLLTLQWPGKKSQDAGAFSQSRALIGERFG